MKSIVITSIANDKHPILKKYADQCKIKNIPFIVIGDKKSPAQFSLTGCDYWGIKKQKMLKFKLAKITPLNHYSRKNIGYLIAIKNGATEIIETDDDNIPYKEFWKPKKSMVESNLFKNTGWVNVYQYFTNQNVWPRGFPLEELKNKNQKSDRSIHGLYHCPIQQGLANLNPDVDAVYRLTQPLPIRFENKTRLALGTQAWSPFNSQNTTWFKEAFPLLYLPSYCSFRMTDIWRSYIAQRIAWECDWNILYHEPTVYQVRNNHDLLKDFKDEIPGYIHNFTICFELQKLKLKKGRHSIVDNMVICYQKLIEMSIINKNEMLLLRAWIKDVSALL